jgi:hypothetical protein
MSGIAVGAVTNDSGSAPSLKGEMQGRGPRTFRVISEQAAKLKFDF